MRAPPLRGAGGSQIDYATLQSLSKQVQGQRGLWQVVRPRHCQPNHRPRQAGRAHVQPQHPLLQGCHLRRADRHGELHPRARPRRQCRENPQPRHLLRRSDDKGANTRKEFTAAGNIVSAHLRARSTGDFTRAELTAAAQMQEAEAYDRGTSTDKTATPAGGGTDDNNP